MAAKNKVKTVIGVNSKQILAFPQIFGAVGCIVNGDGVDAVDGRKIIKAGTPVGGAESVLENEQAVLSVVAAGAEDTIQGVVMHDVDVTTGDDGVSLLIFGFVNQARLDDSVEITAEAKAALNGKVTFMNRNDMR